mgnify:CR=1 FL=1
MNSIKPLIFLVIFLLALSCKSQDQNSINHILIESHYDDIDAAISFYHELKSNSPEDYNFEDENELNNLGYRLLNDGRVEDAIKIFTLLVSEFPTSANPYDSLGEAYLINGNQSLALKNYKKSLALNPDNDNADRVIVSIENENRDRNKFYKKYSKNEYLEDLDQLALKLTTANPHPYKFMSKADFWRVVEQKKDLITNETTYGEFIWHCSELVANINCIHSGLGYFNQESEMLPVELRFPLETRFIGKKLFVTDPLINTDVTAGAEILTINGVSAEKLQEEIYRHISSQGHIETSKKYFYNSYGTAYIAYALGFPQTFTITIKDRNRPIKLVQLTMYKRAKRHFATNLCDSKDLCFDTIDSKTAILTIINSGAYYGNRFSIYKEFIDDSFQKIQEQKIEHLIVDMRSNGGGPGNTGVYLLQHLVDKPFVYKKVSEGSNVAGQTFTPNDNRFKGNTYFLIDGEGGSTTGHILSFVKQRKLATIIGEELGGNHFCTGGQRPYKLTNTEVFYYVGRYTHISSADSFPDERGIMPDHYVTENIKDYLNNDDRVMDYTLRLIEGK